MWEMHSRHMDMLLVNWLDMGVVPDAWPGASPGRAVFNDASQTRDQGPDR